MLDHRDNVLGAAAVLVDAREAERAALVDLAGAVRAAKASGVGVTELAGLLGYSRRAVYDLLERPFPTAHAVTHRVVSDTAWTRQT